MIEWWLFVLGYVVSFVSKRTPGLDADDTSFSVQLYGSSCQNSSYFAIWLKAAGFSVDLRNIIPTGTSLISGFCVVMVSQA